MADPKHHTPTLSTTDIALVEQPSGVSSREQLHTQLETGSQDVAAAAPPRSKFRSTAILVALYLTIFIAALDQTIIATSIPTIASQLHSASGYFWIGGAYYLATAASGPIWAKCSDIWGRKLALLGSVLIFGTASILAAVSSSMRMLIASRALQGTAGGGIIQLVMITISDLYSVRERTFYYMLLEVIWALAGGAGPLLGGAFTQLVSWRWNFWINLPVCATTFVMLLVYLDVHNPRTGLVDGLKTVDWLGTASILGVVLMLLLGLDFGGATFPWNSPTVICLLVFGGVMIGVFLYSEKRVASDPLMPLGLFNNWSTNAAMIVCFMHGMVYTGATYYLPLYFQSAKEASPLRSGVLILAMVLPEATAGAVAGFSIHRTGRYREVIWVGLVLLTLGTSLYIMLKPDTPIATITIIEILEGIGSGCLFQAPLIAVQVMASQADTASATATFGFVREVASVISVVIGGVVFQNGMELSVEGLRDAGLSDAVIKALSAGQAAANVDIIGTIPDMAQRTLVKEAFAWSLRNMFILYACVAAVGLLSSLAIKHVHLSTEHTETKTGLDRRGS